MFGLVARVYGERERGIVLISFKHSNILTFKHFLLHIYRYRFFYLSYGDSCPRSSLT